MCCYTTIVIIHSMQSKDDQEQSQQTVTRAPAAHLIFVACEADAFSAPYCRSDRRVVENAEGLQTTLAARKRPWKTERLQKSEEKLAMRLRDREMVVQWAVVGPCLLQSTP